MSTLRYLAYGSNLHPERLRRRTPSAALVTTCELPGWRLSFEKRGHDGSAKATITHTGDRAHRVHAAVYDMVPAEKPALDRVEGLNQGYHEHALSLPGIGEVWTYLAETEYTDASLVPFRWYRDLVVAGARFHRFPGIYVETIERVRVADDPDPFRQREHDVILAAMRGDP
ncbi:MAG: gamma-glutamylcyclotransferase [Gammaproteobacteria bacterium]|jgi:gamma-glutamylcyclotransferase